MDKKKCGFVLLIFGIAFIIVGVVIEVVPQQMMPSLIKDKLSLVEGSDTFETFSNPGKLPVTMKFYFWDLKNYLGSNHSAKLLEEGGMPVVEEKGPYVYREIRKRKVHGFSDDKTELTFSETTSYEFDENASNGKETDWISGLNMPMLTAFGSLAKVDPNYQGSAKVMFNNMAKMKGETVVQTKTIKDWLWGSESKILQEILKMPPSIVGDLADNIPEGGKFGYMMDNAGNTSYVIGTGYEDLNDVGQIRKYNNMSELNFWGSCYSNKLQGSDGTIFHPNINPKETLYMFTADLCRSIYATKQSEEIVQGIKTYLFSLPDEVFANADKNPDNEGFCEPKPCLGDGLLRVSNCRHDAPLVITQPHLCGADPNVRKTITGLNPDPTKHNTQLFIEPNLGVMVEAHKRLQFNALILPEAGMELTSKMTNGQIVPLFWIVQGFTADDDFAGVIKSGVSAIRFFPDNGKAIFYAMITLGIIMIIIAFFFVGTPEKKDNFNVPPVSFSSVKKSSSSGHQYQNQGYVRQ